MQSHPDPRGTDKEFAMMFAKLRRSLGLALMAATVLLSNAAAAATDEAAVKRALLQKYPDIQIEALARTPMAGLYEVFAGGEIFYVDADVNFMIVKGSMIDAARKTDLTEERLRVLTAIKFEQLPLDLAFRMVKGNGKRKMAYFTDPNCPYCKRLDQELATISDVTVHVFLYPVLGADSYDKAKDVWCSKDRAKVYTDLMLNGNPPKAAGGECDTPIEKIVAFGRQKGISATPTMFFADGQRVAGAIAADQLNKMLDNVRPD
jgi:thiol:disulfide interchange protein DsbC